MSFRFTPCLLTYVPSLLSSSPNFSPQIQLLEMISVMSPVPLIPAEDMVLNVRLNIEGSTGHMIFARNISGWPKLFYLTVLVNAFSTKLPCRLCHGTPWHWDQDPTLHLFN